MSDRKRVTNCNAETGESWVGPNNRKSGSFGRIDPDMHVSSGVFFKRSQRKGEASRVLSSNTHPKTHTRVTKRDS